MTIIETTSNQFYFVADYEDKNLAHVWRGLRVKYTGKGIWKVVGKREEMVRKEGCRAVPIEVPAPTAPPTDQLSVQIKVF